MERVRNSVKGYYWGRLITYFLVCCLILNTSLPVALAEVVLDEIIGETDIITVSPLNGGTTQDIFASDGAIGHFSDFDIATGHFVDCVQPSPDASALFRVTSGSRTEIFGRFDANSNIYLINTAGILFARGSEINVNRLVASGLDMDNDVFDDVLEGGEMVFANGHGEVKNEGTVHANSIYLIGDNVSSKYAISAKDGLIVMAAGDQVRLSQDGSNISVDVTDTHEVLNSSRLYAGNGSVVLASGDLFASAISNTGIISGGTVTARAARVENHGSIYVEANPADGKGGSINLTGIEEVVLGPDINNNQGKLEANAGPNGDGGTITIESEGKITIHDNTLISANGGSVSGNGGTITLQALNAEETEGIVTIADDILTDPTPGDGIFISAIGGGTSGNGGDIKIISETFKIAANFDAKAASTDFEPGTLMIDSSSVTIANGANPAVGDMPAAPAENTLYEVDIENLSDKGTSVVVNADDKITVKDIADGTIKGSIGNIELHGTGLTSSVLFEDNTNTIRTTLGDIAIGSGSGGLNIGNLITGDVELGAAPGQIFLSAAQAGDIDSGGDITTGYLIIEGGSGHAEINVDASGELTVNGDVIVGRTTPIDNIPDGPDAADAEAMIYLKAGDHANINQQVSAFADATNPGDSTAYIEISAGTNDIVEGDAFINGNVLADAKASDGTAEAIVKIEAWGKTVFAEGVEVHATADDKAAKATEATNYEDDEDPEPYESGDHAQIIIKAENKLLTGLPDFFPDIHMGDTVEGNVLTNDLGPADIAELLTGPSHAEPGSFTLNEDGTFTYTPKAGFVGEDTFTYKVSSEAGEEASPILVTITITNELPTVTDVAEVIHMGDPLNGNLLADEYVNDPDGDSLSVVLNGTKPEHGTVTLLEDGTYIYTPDAGYVGEDSFTYEVTDGQLDGELVNPVVVTGTATITIGNNPPTPKDDTATTRTSEPVTGNVLKNDTDPDNDSLSVVLNGTAPEHGTLKLNADGSFTYTSDDDFVGEDKFTYILTDGAIDAEPIIGTVIITVNEMPIFIPPAPLPEKIEFEISGYPALAKWVAEELGVDERMVDIWIANTLASSRNINPVDTYTRLKAAAIVLQDSDGVYIGALTQVVNEFASSFTPPTEEQMASIAEAITRNGDDDSHYALAGKYLRALADYIGILNYEMGFSAMESVQFVTDKYINRLTGDENVGVAAFLAASASALAG